QIMYNYPAM
nr:Chain C, MTB [Mycobacterium tuberculosis]